MSMTTTHNFCEFIDVGLDKYECIRCGTIVESYDGGPPALLCAFTYESSPNHPDACSEQQFVNRLNICSVCDHFVNNTCDLCGCRISSNIEFKNKILWKNESCPINKWGPEI